MLYRWSFLELSRLIKYLAARGAGKSFQEKSFPLPQNQNLFFN